MYSKHEVSATAYRRTHGRFCPGRYALPSAVPGSVVAVKAGLATGVQLVAVNGKTYAVDDLKNAITTNKGNNPPLEMLVRFEVRYKTIVLDYHDGLR